MKLAPAPFFSLTRTSSPISPPRLLNKDSRFNWMLISDSFSAYLKYGRLRSKTSSLSSIPSSTSVSRKSWAVRMWMFSREAASDAEISR